MRVGERQREKKETERLYERKRDVVREAGKREGIKRERERD
jgi:hypothetical protein